QGPGEGSRPADDAAPERRGVSLDVRLTETEREAIRRRAPRLGVKPSRWGRDVMLDALDARRSNELEAVMRTAQIEAERTAQAHADRSEERRVGKEGRNWRWAGEYKNIHRKK